MTELDAPRSSHAQAWDERVAAYEKEVRANPWRKKLREFSRNKLLFTGSVLGILIVGLGLIGPLIIGSDYAGQSLRNTHLPPLSEGVLARDGSVRARPSGQTLYRNSRLFVRSRCGNFHGANSRHGIGYVWRILGWLC